MRKGILLLLILLGSTFFLSKAYTQVLETDRDSWVKQKLESMSLEEKVGQLFMIRAHSDLGPDHIKSVESQIEKYQIGGLCFFQGTPTKQAELTNQYQKLSKLPLMIAIDGEWGLGMRHKKTAFSYPRQLTLGAISDNTLIFEMGKRIASHLKRIGTHVNFAPVVDININPNNPVIHTRSFGEDIFNVTTKSFAYMKGMQDYDIMACVKHFPGHGDTDVDSHYDLPVISHTRARLDSVELTPFRVLSELGVASVMSAHLSVPSIDDSPNRPTSLSEKAIDGILRNQMHFDGIVFTDALEMKGVAKHFEPGEMEVEALLAGNDILLLPLDTEKAFSSIIDAIKTERISIESINKKVERILKAKHRFVMNHDMVIENLEEISADVNTPKDKALKAKLYEKAITLVKDADGVIPIKDIDPKKIASITIGKNRNPYFRNEVAKFGIEKQLHISKADLNTSEVDKISEDLNNYDIVFLSLHDMSFKRSKDFGISKESFDLIYKLNSTKKTCLNYKW